MQNALEEAYAAALGPEHFPSPCFVTDMAKLCRNVALLDNIQHRTGAKILLALKAFSQWKTFPKISRAFNGPLYGCCASSPDEARLAREEFGGEVHAFAAALSDEDFFELLPLADHIVFNSFAQWQRFAPAVESWNIRAEHTVECGLRINPEHSEGAAAIYNPCSPGSRLGIRRAQFEGQPLAGISGLHFHTLCEQGADALARTLDVVEKNFGEFLLGMKWLNFGGGHHITREGYDLDLLCACIERIQQKYALQVYLEPGEAVALNAGVLIATVLDVVQADMPVAILDTSAACHMPDVLEMPYKPYVIGAGEPGEKPWTCRLAGKSCLAGDIIGEYSFPQPLTAGQRLIFTDMAIYSMVKTNTFNGLRLPAQALWDSATNSRHIIKTFGYSDFKERLS